MENMYDSRTWQWHSHQWAQRLNFHPEMVHTVSGYMARFTIIFSLPYSNEANKPEYGQLHIFDPAETRRWLENQSDQLGTAKVM